ncbi:hypothetical protein A3Q56_00427 [Intoshia linei]|uniref:Uncharacterized protein n=1 Tax=Intoshia linei TaxID=1819745 RepID=A0A177BBV7_9BILA|nr:hypothetical protein A3Q56_00427 [Intoshia linei]
MVEVYNKTVPNNSHHTRNYVKNKPIVSKCENKFRLWDEQKHSNSEDTVDYALNSQLEISRNNSDEDCTQLDVVSVNRNTFLPTTMGDKEELHCIN